MRQKGLRLKDIFTEVEHQETLGLRRRGQLRLFHMAMHSNRFFTGNLQNVLYHNLARYAFSRAKMEDYKQNDELDVAIAEAMRIMRENIGDDPEGTGSAMSEILVYAFLEEYLKANKILSRVELFSELSQFKSECKGIHLLPPDESAGELHYQLVFGASRIVGELEDAITYAFETIKKIQAHEEREIVMLQKTSLSRMVNKKEAAFLKTIILPEPGEAKDYDIAYGVFLGYSLGLDKDRGEEFVQLAKAKMEFDLRRWAPYMAKKIKECGLQNSSFYFYLVPFDDAEVDSREIMDNVLKGGVIA
jgi:hypothetical protein